MKTIYLVSEKERVTVRFGQLVILSNGIRVFVEKIGHEWKATELLTGLGIPLKDENKKRCSDCLWELDKKQDSIYNALRSIFSSVETVRQLSPIMLRRGFEDGELNDICYYAENDFYSEFLDEYKCLCEYALKWAKDFGKGEAE